MYRMRFFALAAVVCAATALSAKADSVYNVTVTAATGVTSACTAGLTGTLDINAGGGVFLSAPAGSTSGCYIGASGSQPGGTPAITTFIGGLHSSSAGLTPTEGTAAQLNALTDHTWYAEFGEECGGTSQCVASNNSTNSSSGSADIDILINNSNASETFTVYDNTGAADTTSNGPGPSTCSSPQGTSVITVAAHTICYEDLSTGASLAVSSNAPPAPEPASVALLGSGLVLTAGILRRRKRSR